MQGQIDRGNLLAYGWQEAWCGAKMTNQSELTPDERY